LVIDEIINLIIGLAAIPVADALTYEIFIATVALNLVAPNEYISFVASILSDVQSLGVCYMPEAEVNTGILSGS